MKAECTTITENNEEFIQSTYNGISVYQRKKDGFINVTKLCFDGGRDFRTFKRSKRWNEIIQYYLKFEAVQNCTPIYELRKSYNLMQGQFLIPDLVHFVAEGHIRNSFFFFCSQVEIHLCFLQGPVRY